MPNIIDRRGLTVYHDDSPSPTSERTLDYVSTTMFVGERYESDRRAWPEEDSVEAHGRKHHASGDGGVRITASSFLRAEGKDNTVNWNDVTLYLTDELARSLYEQLGEALDGPLDEALADEEGS